MLLWEALTVPRDAEGDGSAKDAAILCPKRLPYDRRCATITKSGKRCRGRIRSGGEYCPLHDPARSTLRVRRALTPVDRARRRLSHLPDGYLRKLSNRRAVGAAMDRLYRELRLGLVTTEMGGVLFGILTRLLDSGLVDAGKVAAPSRGRSRSERLRPKLTEILTRRERAEWRRAVDNAPSSVLQSVYPLAGGTLRVNGAVRGDLSESVPQRALPVAS